MAPKSPPNLRHLDSKRWLLRQGQRPVIALPRNVESFPSATEEIEGPPVLDDDRLAPAFREVLESDDFQVALVFRGASDHIRGPHVEPFSNAAPVVLFPFNWKDLVARVCEFVRSPCAFPAFRFARFDDVCVDFSRMEVSRMSGERVELLTQEFKALKCFLQNPGRVLSRGELLSEAWGYENYPSTRTVDNHVLKLRQKLERDPARPVHFRTVHGVGYKFVP